MSTQKKIVIVGDAGVGKSSFVSRLKAMESKTRVSVLPEPEELEPDSGMLTKYIPTMGVEVCSIGNYRVWDTAGQEKYGMLKEGYYVGATAAIIMFDMTSNVSYINVEAWYRALRSKCPAIPIVVVGNKSESKQCVVDIESGTFIPISVKTKNNIIAPIDAITNQLKNARTATKR